MTMTVPAPRTGQAISWRFLLLAFLAALLLLAGQSINLTPQVALAASIGLLCMGCWATGAIPEILTTLMFFALAMLTAVAPAPVVFSGFASSAFWLVLSGMIVGLAISKTGLGVRIAQPLAQALSKSYASVIAGVVALSYGLSFLMPSNMGRISLLIPIMLALADHVGLGPGRPGRTGVVLAVGFATFMLSTSILPANVPNLVMAGAAETIYGLHFSYLPYLLLHAPVLGLLKGVVLVLLILWLFPDRLSPVRELETVAQPAPITAKEIRLVGILAITLVLWMTDAIHHIQPAWIGLASAVVCLMPRIGVIEPESFANINFRTVFYVAGLLGLVATVDHTGLGQLLGRFLLNVVPLGPDAPFANFAALVGLASSLSLVGTANGEPALFTPMARHISAITGFNLSTVVMTQVIGFSTVIFPYQAPPIIVAIELGGVSIAAATRLALILALVSLVLLVPLNYLWWRLLGAL
ncbi:SLC13 family permease [Bradyrhizobium prioriisuperbiae]|uniref:SLC13 family permease n=1 Tax=Bradyrhizobium prioriisuperbiae TaxID=2854389 RepID=UPI0028EF5186|nr:SLC13 family permease [Bradyrhizobium prioritasuperba]